MSVQEKMQSKSWKNKCMFDGQGVPTRIEQGGEEDQAFCFLSVIFFLSGLTTRPHFLPKRGKELKSKIYH